MDDNNGLNQFLQPTGSPIAMAQQQLNPITFDASTEANAISQTKIPFLSFSKGQGGTLTLGGASNGDGVLLVKTASGGTAIKEDNTGITIYGGSLTIQNTSGSNAFDGSGVVSVSNFDNENTINGNAAQTFSGTAFSDVTNSSYTLAVNRATNVFFIYSFDAHLVESVGNTCNANVDLNIDGGNVSQVRFDHGADWMQTYTGYYITQLGAGTHTIKLVANINTISGTGNMFIQGFQNSYIKLGT